MAVQTFTSLPDSFTAGDAFSFSRTLADFSAASSWTVEYLFRSDTGQKIRVEGSGSGTTWTFTFNSELSGGFDAGHWTYTLLAFLQNDRRTVETGYILVEPDPEADSPPTHAEKVLAALEAALEGRLSKDQAERYSIGGQSIDKIPAMELRKLRDAYRAEVAAERNKDRQRRGLRSKRYVGAKFI